MNSNKKWEKFYKTGKVEDYLKYKQSILAEIGQSMEVPNNAGKNQGFGTETAEHRRAGQNNNNS